MTLRHHEVRGHRLAVLRPADDERRQGPPVVLIHGILVSVRFAPFLLPEQLRQRARWTAIGLPGHAPSVAPAGFSRADVSADWVADLLGSAIAAEAEEPALVIGHSTGACAALAVAARHPDIVRSVVSVSGFLDGRWTGLLGLAQRLARRGAGAPLAFRSLLRASTLAPAAWVGASASLVRKPVRFLRSANAQEALRASYRDACAHVPATLAEMMAGLRAVHATPLANEVTVPVRLVWGDQDPAIPAAHSREIARRLPHVEAVPLAGVGHLPMMEAPAAYAAALGGLIR
ncbi:MAG: alpha/beta hydrolase [Bacteroidota bacterium]